MSSHRTVEPGIPPSETRSAQLVVPVQPALGDCRHNQKSVSVKNDNVMPADQKQAMLGNLVEIIAALCVLLYFTCALSIAPHAYVQRLRVLLVYESKERRSWQIERHECARARGIPICGQYGAVCWPIKNARSNREVSAWLCPSSNTRVFERRVRWKLYLRTFMHFLLLSIDAITDSGTHYEILNCTLFVLTWVMLSRVCKLPGQ